MEELKVKTDWLPSDNITYREFNRILRNLEKVSIYPDPIFTKEYTINNYLKIQDWGQILHIVTIAASCWGLPNPGLDGTENVITAAQINKIEEITQKAWERRKHYVANKQHANHAGSGYCNTGIYTV